MEFCIQALWAIAPGIIVGVVMAFWNRGQKRRDAASVSREQAREESHMFQLDLSVAAAQLAYAIAMAYKRGTPNGEMEEAIEQYERAMEKFRKFERKQMAKISAQP